MRETNKIFETEAQRPLTAIAKKFFVICEKPLWAGILAFLFYVIISIYTKDWGTTSPYNYYNYLGDAFLHGQLHLRLQPTTIHDLSLYNGQLYLYWPPFPAVVSMPLVMLFGVSFSDILFTILIGSLNVGIVAQLLRKCNQRAILDLSPVQRGMLVFTVGFGSAQVTQAFVGTVWEISVLMGLTFVGFTYLVAISLDGWKAFLLAGLCISAAMATRNTLILAGLWPAFYLIQSYWSQPLKRKIWYALLGTAPVLATLALLGLYNYNRFGSFTDIGYAYHNMLPFFRADYEQYGPFSLHYVPRNLYYQWIAYPFLTRDQFEFTMGGSLLLLSPVFFGMFWAVKNRQMRLQTAVLGLTVILLYIPIVLLMGTGFIQFGPRYLLDFMVPSLILTGLGVKYWPNRITGILAAISFMHYLAFTVFMANWK